MNNLEYYKHKKNSNVIKYFKEYKLYNEGNFKSEDIKRLICLIIKNINIINESFRKEILEKWNNYFKFDNNFISKLLLYYKNKNSFSKKEFKLLLIKDSKSKYFIEKLLKVLKKVLKELNKPVRVNFNKEDSNLKIDPKSIGDSDNIDESIDNFVNGVKDSENFKRN
ncbi:hypothetical protein H8356DRAFT_1345348 [Neocallimastix lanati (nom. inval.)]|nr:hypothetical protein H8356DRAFT_1345348 [Neocallimastix sp. JGI-2020a]